MDAPNLRLAYLFWIPSLFGIAGLHRFYLGKPLSGFLYLITGGLMGIGTIYDGLTMPHHVRKARLNHTIDALLDDGARPTRAATAPRNARSVQQEILQLASARHGVVTPSRVALRAEIAPDKARDELDKLVDQGFAEVRVTRDGLIVYAFPEFLDDIGRRELEELS